MLRSYVHRWKSAGTQADRQKAFKDDWLREVEVTGVPLGM